MRYAAMVDSVTELDAFLDLIESDSTISSTDWVGLNGFPYPVHLLIDIAEDTNLSAELVDD